MWRESMDEGSLQYRNRIPSNFRNFELQTNLSIELVVIKNQIKNKWKKTNSIRGNGQKDTEQKLENFSRGKLTRRKCIIIISKNQNKKLNRILNYKYDRRRTDRKVEGFLHWKQNIIPQVHLGTPNGKSCRVVLKGILDTNNLTYIV